MDSGKHKLTDNFSWSEFRCPCCQVVRLDLILVNQLQKLRDRIMSPIIITSGYRCEKRNKEIGGAKNSLHTEGKAADIIAPKMPLFSLYQTALLIPGFRDGGIGVYPLWEDAEGKKHDNFLHLDLGSKRRWGRVRGEYCNLVTAMEVLKNA